MTLLAKTIKRIEPLDEEAMAKARERLEQLTMPYWALGRLMDLALELAGMTRSVRPEVENRTVVIMAGDHGVVDQGVSKYRGEVTAQMVRNFINGGAGISAMARVADAEVVVVDMGVASDLDHLVEQGLLISRKARPGTFDMSVGPAMTREEAAQSVEAGIELALELADTTQIFGTGDMGIGNTTPSSAIVASITGSDPKEVTGRGTGIDDEQLTHKIEVIERSLHVNKPDPRDPLDVLAKVGGFEIGGIAGLILGAASARRPVVIDGFISTAGALIAHGLHPMAADYMIAAHLSVERGHRIALDYLGKKPLMQLDLRLGEGTGAALAMTLVEAAYRILTEVATFEEAAVSTAEGS